MVFFEWNSAALQAEAKATLDDAVRAYQKTGAADISLAGHADKTGTEIYNLARIIHPVEFRAPSFEHLASAGHT